jgi:serine/threonine-protein kinase
VAIHPGDTLAGYRVTQLLGRGGMGEVWAAQSPDGSREVAIKVLLPNAAMKPDLVARFEREARVTASIESEFVCKLLGHERDPTGAHLLIFEKLTGESLSERLKRELYLPFAEVGPLVADAFAGLAAAHRVGVIHRDLKPGNIFIEWTNDPQRPERAKILDFGISKLTQSGDTLTRGETIGTPHYMAPEQARGEPVDIRTDLYALGAIAYRALTGHQPFPGDETAVILVDVLGKMPPRPSSLIKLRSAVDDVLALALAKSPQQRFATPDEFADALEAAIEGRISASVRERAQRVYDQTRWE